MAVTYRDVLSDNVRAVGYDPDTEELYVVWNTGRESIYSGVPADVAERAAKAWSVGSFMRTEVKNRYQHRYG